MERQLIIEKLWDERENLSPTSTHALEPVRSVLNDLDQGRLRVGEKVESCWIVHEWLKKALLLSFRLHDNRLMREPLLGYDKIGSKFEGWTQNDYHQAGFRVVPGALVRHATYVAPDCVLMPSFTNFGVYIDQGTMIDMGAQIGSCAQIGARCHISAGVVIGGVVEPLQASPVIIEDHCFIGAHAAVVEGVLIEEGAVLGLGTKIGASTPILDRASGKVSYGKVPAYSVVVAGTMPASKESTASLACAVIVKQVDAKTRAKTAINDLLRA